jgi:hypothetical protein
MEAFRLEPVDGLALVAGEGGGARRVREADWLGPIGCARGAEIAARSLPSRVIAFSGEDDPATSRASIRVAIGGSAPYRTTVRVSRPPGAGVPARSEQSLRGVATRVFDDPSVA